MNIFEMQEEFLKSGELCCKDWSPKRVNESKDQIHEEFNEWAFEKGFICDGRPSLRNINDLKECLDLMYVCAQYMNVNVGPEIAIKMLVALHENNMEKFPNGKCVKSESGKVLKPEGFNKTGWKPEFLKLAESLK